MAAVVEVVAGGEPRWRSAGGTPTYGRPRQHHQSDSRRDGPVQLEHADAAVAAQSQHAHGWRSLAVHLTRPRQQLDDDQRARQGHRSQCATTDGRCVLAARLQRTRRRWGAWRRVHPVEERRLRRQRVRHHDRACRISDHSGHPLGGYRRRQHPAEPRRGHELGGSRQEHSWRQPRYYVSGIEASRYDGRRRTSRSTAIGTTISSHTRQTTDYGKTWTSVSGNLGLRKREFDSPGSGQSESLYARRSLAFVSLDDGRPGTVHAESSDRTHGRRQCIQRQRSHSRDTRAACGSWTTSRHCSVSRRWLAKPSVLFPTRDAVAWKTDRRIGTAVPGDHWWMGENAPRGTAISFYMKSGSGDAKITIADAVTGREFRVATMPSSTGLNRWQWDLCSTPQPGAPAGGRGGGGGGGGGGGCPGGGRMAPEGTYRVTVNVGGLDVGSQVFKVLEDIWLNERNWGQTRFSSFERTRCSGIRAFESDDARQ